MPDSTSLVLFVVAGVMLNFTPGPDMLYVMANGVGQGRRAGVASALGVGAGCVVHTAAAALGLSALLASSAVAYEAVRYAGAAYLLYLGLRAFTGEAAALSAGRAPRTGLATVFRRGMVTNVLNPKVALFFLAFLPQFVDPTRGDVVWQFVLLGTLFNTTGTLVNVGVGLAAGSLAGWLGSRPGASRAQRWFTGSVFLALGARLALVAQR